MVFHYFDIDKDCKVVVNFVELLIMQRLADQ